MSSRGRDFYAILGIPRDADANTIKKAYRALAMRWHPDKNPNNQAEAQAKFQEISEAYEILSNPEKRSLYDRFGEAGINPSASGGGGPGGAYTFHRADDIFRSFFGGSPFGGSAFGGSPFASFFGGDDDEFGQSFSFQGGRVFVSSGGPRRRPPTAPPPATISVSCPLEQLFTGTAKDLRYTRVRNGKQEEVMLHVDIPAGTTNATQFPFPGEGDIQPGALPQDVVFVVKELSHPRFTRVKDDLVIVMRVSLKESLCGVNRYISGIDHREIPVVVTKLFKPGTEIVIKGEGMTKVGGGRGDLRVQFDVVYPDDVDGEVQAMIESILPDLDG
jgi:DnaJ-class molecular chaperone